MTYSYFFGTEKIKICQATGLSGPPVHQRSLWTNPVDCDTIVSEMKKDGQLKKVQDKLFQNDQTKYIPCQAHALELLPAKELSDIDNVLRRLSHKTAKEISDLSSKDIRWIRAEHGQAIDYEITLERTKATSVTTYPDDDIL
jgi:hypothetical protein